MKVASTPTTTPISSDCRVPQTSWPKTSWPNAVVPSRWCADGARLSSYCRALGSRTEVNNCGTTARIVKIVSSTTPTAAFPFVRTARSTAPPGRCRRGWVSTPVGASKVAVIRSGAFPHARIEPRGDEVTDQDGEQHRDGDQQEQRLHQREVLVVDRVEQHVAQAGIVVDVLHENRAADDEAERHGEPGQVGQHCVPRGVAVHD